MNFDKTNNYPLFKIVDKTNDSKKPKIVYMSDNIHGKGAFTEYKCQSNEEIVVLPNDKQERECSSFYGRSGSGKSFQVKKYAECWSRQKKNKGKNIVIFSSVNEDKSLDSLGDKLKRIKLNRDFVHKPVSKEMFANSLIIFDDIDVISDKQIKAKVYKIQDTLLQVGRHLNTTICSTSHNFSNRDNKIGLNESHKVFIFPQCGVNKSLQYMLENYRSLEINQIQKLKKGHGRWLCIDSGRFTTIICANKAYILNLDDCDD